MDKLLIYEIVKLQFVIQYSLLRAINFTHFVIFHEIYSMEIFTFISGPIKRHQLFHETYFHALVFLSIYALKNKAPYVTSLKNSYIYAWY